MSDPRQPARSLWFALVVWVGLSVVALTLAASNIMAGVAAAAIGGVLFGALSAARLDGRHRRRRRSPTAAPEPEPPVGAEDPV